MVAHGREGHGQLWRSGKDSGRMDLGELWKGSRLGMRNDSWQGTGRASMEMWQSTSGNSTYFWGVVLLIFNFYCI